ncbi:fimbrial protein [Pasteurella sp. PK-2025]|uniref:fimbrial protein n=1 Tax=Pasteurella sp. PK-2025 TaxID=3413133 RepID=UPI003C75B55B
MKKLLIALSMAALFSGSALADELVISDEGGEGVLAPSLVASTATQSVGGGQVQFFGKVLAPTCTVKSGHENQSVYLPDVMVNEIDDNIVKSKTFEITLTNCPSSTERTVGLRFAPNTSTTDNLLDNKASEGTNLGLKLSNNNKQIALNSNSGEGLSELKPLTSSGDITYSFTAEYAKRDKGAVTLPGAFSATLPFFIVYK